MKIDQVVEVWNETWREQMWIRRGTNGKT